MPGSYYVCSVITDRFGENENEINAHLMLIHTRMTIYISRGPAKCSTAISKHEESQDS